MHRTQTQIIDGPSTKLSNGQHKLTGHDVSLFAAYNWINKADLLGAADW